MCLSNSDFRNGLTKRRVRVAKRANVVWIVSGIEVGVKNLGKDEASRTEEGGYVMCSIRLYFDIKSGADILRLC